jgi:hypothetical protein
VKQNICNVGSILFHAGFNEKDVEAAEHEEEEAKVIQKRLVEQLDEGDFLLDMFRKVFCCSIHLQRIFHVISAGMLL